MLLSLLHFWGTLECKSDWLPELGNLGPILGVILKSWGAGFVVQPICYSRKRLEPGIPAQLHVTLPKVKFMVRVSILILIHFDEDVFSVISCIKSASTQLFSEFFWGNCFVYSCEISASMEDESSGVSSVNHLDMKLWENFLKSIWLLRQIC